MVKYHPDVRFLTDYSAGSLPRSQALCVAAHLHYCQACKARIRELNELGTALFSSQTPHLVQPDAWHKLLARLPDTAAASTSTASTPTAHNSDTETARAGALPKALNRLCKGSPDNLKWLHMGKHFRFAPLHLGDRTRETSLLHIKAGGAVPQHRHRGDEITVVLQGSFSDQADKYHVGDFIVRTQGEVHRPVAAQNEDCLCLATLDAPIQMSNWLLRLLMPLINLRLKPGY